MRISPWVVKFNATIVPAKVQPGQTYLRVEDFFTTRDGSWELSNKEGSVTDWARERYLKPYGSPDYFDDGGGDHHLFGGIYDLSTGKMQKTGKIHYYTWTDNANQVDMPVKDKSGWANVIANNLFYPDMDGDNTTGARGAWAWRPTTDLPYEEVRGGGLPFNWHVSWFATWVVDVAPTGEPEEPSDLEGTVQGLETWAIAWSKTHPEGPQYEPTN